MSGVIEVWAGDATANDHRHSQGAVEDRDLWLMSRCQRRDDLNCPKRPNNYLVAYLRNCCTNQKKISCGAESA